MFLPESNEDPDLTSHSHVIQGIEEQVKYHHEETKIQNVGLLKDNWSTFLKSLKKGGWGGGWGGSEVLDRETFLKNITKQDP